MSAPNPLLLPLLTRGNRQRIEHQVVSFARGDARFAVVRQSGLPVHEVSLSAKGFSPAAFFELRKLVATFKPDVLHAWGSSAQLAARWLVGSKKTALPLVWSVARTEPISKQAGWLDRFKFRRNVQWASACRAIVYPSATAAAHHRRAGLPEELGRVIAAGVDVRRFNPDDAARARVREQLQLPKEAMLVGMYAPFQPQFDHATFVKAFGEVVRQNSNLYCVLAGRGVVKGNAALSALIGGGILGTRVRVVGEWTDLGALFNACDVVCSTALTDAARLMLAMSMLCGTMCAATSVGAQGEVLGSYGANVEPGSVDAMARGIRRLLEMPGDRKAFMAFAARNHILQNFNMARSLECYQDLYVEVATGEAAPAAPTAVAFTKETLQTDPIAQIIANRAASLAERFHSKAAQPTAEQPADDAAEKAFGTIERAATPIPEESNEVKSKETKLLDTGSMEATSIETKPTQAKPKPRVRPDQLNVMAAAVAAHEAKAPGPLASDTIDFDMLATQALEALKNPTATVTIADSAPAPAQPPPTGELDILATQALRALSPAAAIPDERAEKAEPARELWSDADASLMDDILVEADPETAKANAAKAAAAEKAAHAKAAASAALAAALAGNPDAARTLDPKALASALNITEANAANTAAPRTVAGKPPPAPDATDAKSKLAKKG